MKNYLGNSLQLRGAEQYVLQSGKGDGMHFLNIRNGLGLEVWISLDRCGDISRLNFKGDNMGYFSPCGYVAPQYYEIKGKGFLKSFTAGFFTTCGLTSVGEHCVDDGEELPMHGTVSNIPATLISTEETDVGITVKLSVTDAVLFGRKLVLNRVYNFSYTENTISLTDTITNEADIETPYMILYHCNMGYPLLSENSIVKIPHNSIVGVTDHAQNNIDTALIMEKPQAGYKECCYCYDVKNDGGKAHVGIYNPDISKGLIMTYDKSALPCFTEWKMMGKRDYALGLEPANCTPEGRAEMRRRGKLQFLAPEESRKNELKFTFCESLDKFVF